MRFIPASRAGSVNPVCRLREGTTRILYECGMRKRRSVSMISGTSINNDIAVKPYSSRYKVYIIDEAEKMTEAAQNALLKTIEEPPEYAVILLLTDNANAFLPTILSRCVMIHMNLWTRILSRSI